MTTSIRDIKDTIVGHLSPLYAMCDKGHQIGHYEAVYNAGVAIDKAIGGGFDHKLIAYVAYVHDVFCWSRKNHHELSSAFVLGTDHPVIVDHLTDNERKIVAAGCMEHRASRTEPFTSVFSEMMNAADREEPKSFTEMFNRCIMYREHKTPQATKEEMVVDSIAHLKEKYGHNGYASYPACYELTFGNVLSGQRDIIEAVTVDNYQEYLV